MSYVTITQVYKPGGINGTAGTPNFFRQIDDACVKVTWTSVQVGGMQQAEVQMFKAFEDTTDLVAGDWLYYACMGGTLAAGATAGATSISVTGLGDPTSSLAQSDILANDYILISNGVTTDLMKVASITGSSPGPWTVTLAAAPGQNTTSLLNSYSGNAIVARLQFSGSILSRDTRTTALSNQYTIKVQGFASRYNNVLCNADIVQQDSATSILNLCQSYATTIPEVIVNSANFAASNGAKCSEQSTNVQVLKVIADILKTENSANANTNYAFWVDAARQAHHQSVPGANTITGSGTLGTASNLLLNPSFILALNNWTQATTGTAMSNGTDLRYNSSLWNPSAASVNTGRFYVYLNRTSSSLTESQQVAVDTSTSMTLTGKVGISQAAIPSGSSVNVQVYGVQTGTVLGSTSVGSSIAETPISISFGTGTNTAVIIKCVVSTGSTIPWTAGSTASNVCLAAFTGFVFNTTMASATYTIDVVNGNSYGDSLGPLEVTDMDMTNMVNTAIVTGGQVDSTKQPLSIIVQDTTSQNAWGYYEGTFSNSFLTDEATAAAWGAGQLNLTAYPLTTAKLTFTVASGRLTCQDLLGVTGFTDGSQLQLNPVQIQYVATNKSRIITGTAQLAQARPGIKELMAEGAAQHAIRQLNNLPKTNIDSAYVVSGLGLSVSGLTVTVAAGVVSYNGTLYNIPQASFTLGSTDVQELGVQIGGTPPSGVTLPAVVEKPNVTGLSRLHGNNIYSITRPTA